MLPLLNVAGKVRLDFPQATAQPAAHNQLEKVGVRSVDVRTLWLIESG
jgi:hypothetical protein